MAASKELTKNERNARAIRPEKHIYEFLGPPGAFILVFGLPWLVLASVLFCNDVSGCPAPSLLSPRTLTLEKLKQEIPLPENGLLGLFDLEVAAWVVAYYGLIVALQLLLPGNVVKGSKLAGGGRLEYKFNTFSTAVLILAGVTVGTAAQGPDFPLWPFLWDKLPQILTTNILIANSVAIWVYVRSFSVPTNGPNPQNREFAAGGLSGNMLYDFYIGRELNPRVEIPSGIPLIGGQHIDVKMFCEFRPGMIGYMLLNLASCAHQYKVHGYLSDSILLITFSQCWYVMDGFYMEASSLSMIDIIFDGLGWMLSFGDLVWLPFIYSLQTRYLAVYPVNLGLYGLAGVLSVQAFGFWIFRSANNEKHRFRLDPNDPRVSHLDSIVTKYGSRLLTSGWWGRARHINYFGDWFMSWSYCLPTGVAGYLIHSRTDPISGLTTRVIEQGAARGWGMIFTYFFMLFFAVLLVHRERRDEAKCQRKYGNDWTRYTSIVKSRIVPGIY